MKRFGWWRWKRRRKKRRPPRRRCRPRWRLWVCLRRRPWRSRRRPRDVDCADVDSDASSDDASSARAASRTFAAALDEAYREVTENVLVLCMSVPPMMSPMSIMQPSPTKARLFSTSRATAREPRGHLRSRARAGRATSGWGLRGPSCSSSGRTRRRSGGF